MAGKSWLTAITRRKLSAPVALLKKKGMLKGRVLDYGCGKGFDADELGIDGYDPYYRDIAIDGNYSTIVCIYVANVLDAEERKNLYSQLQKLMTPSGRAYLAVRSDVKSQGWTSRKTWQELALLDREWPATYYCPILSSGGRWKMYCCYKSGS